MTIVYILLTVNLLCVVMGHHNIFGVYISEVQHRRSYPNGFGYGFIPLYIIRGPDPVTDYMANHFQPKRFRVPFYRQKRQAADEQHFQDLLESFGGTSTTTSQPTTSDSPKRTDTEAEEVPMTIPKSGFYYLLDWNSFLEIDDQNGRRVNSRINPKFGDPKRFIDVSIP